MEKIRNLKIINDIVKLEDILCEDLEVSKCGIIQFKDNTFGTVCITKNSELYIIDTDKKRDGVIDIVFKKSVHKKDFKEIISKYGKLTPSKTLYQ